MNLDVKFGDLAGKSVFITGGGSGIGAALTGGFLGQGARVAFVQRSDATRFCDQMEADHGSRPLYIGSDVTDIGQLEAAMGEAASLHGPIEVLVNNAANDTRHSTEALDVEGWDANHAVNLRPYFFSSRAAIAGMRKLGGGVIINFTSVSYMTGNAGYPAYATANAGITGLTRVLAREFGPEGIRVNAVAPGWTLTERQLELWADRESLERHLGKQCLKEHLKPEDIVGACLFLASSASRMMTGQVVPVDGGVVTTG